MFTISLLKQSMRMLAANGPNSNPLTPSIPSNRLKTVTLLQYTYLVAQQQEEQ